MSRISIVRWFDAKTDPPESDARLVLALTDDGVLHRVSASRITDAVRGYRGVEFYAWWAELPVPSELTDEDVRNVCVWALDGETMEHSGHPVCDRLRAALGGEKEEA